jgi:hypothetical protein
MFQHRNLGEDYGGIFSLVAPWLVGPEKVILTGPGDA